MTEIITLITLGVIIYFLVKFIYETAIIKKQSENTKKAGKHKERLSTEEFIAREKMRMTNTFYARDFYQEERELKRRGFNAPGIYIFTNVRNNRRYVGQSVRVLGRVRTHLRGRGNDDLHRDLSSGDKFTIELIRLQDSMYHNLNALEKAYITKYNSYAAGYNKTRGNS